MSKLGDCNTCVNKDGCPIWTNPKYPFCYPFKEYKIHNPYKDFILKEGIKIT